MTTRRRKAPKKVGVIGQIKTAFSPGARLGTFIGIAVGGSPPVGSFVICHQELPEATGWKWCVLALLAFGGLLFSAKTVWQWAAAAFQDKWKATGFVLLMEGIMVWSQTPWLAFYALGMLVFINAVASGVTLSQGK